MRGNRIGSYKGYDVIVVSKNEIKRNDCISNTMYVIKETGEIVLNYEVVGHADLEHMSVDEYPKRDRYVYFKEEKKKPERGKRVEAKPVDESVNVDEGYIDKFIKDALAAVLVEPMDYEVKEIGV
jgi:hypothetical protein